jgi:hypothetical protein
MAIANLVIFRLDAAQDRRQLSHGEAWLRKMLKLSLLGLASLERTIARQRSRIRWLAEGDANTKLFHMLLPMVAASRISSRRSGLGMRSSLSKIIN